jgi:hypothetical protein
VPKCGSGVFPKFSARCCASPAAAAEDRGNPDRRCGPPFVAILSAHLGDLESKITSVDVLTILDLRGAQATPEAFMRASDAMKRIGWKRPNKSGMLRFDGKLMVGYVRGNPRWKIVVWRDSSGLSVTSETELRMQT